MHRFKYRDNLLCCENAAIRDIAKRFGTPFYLYSHKTLTDHYDKIRIAFKSLNPLICFSVKANSNLAVLKTLVSRGSGLDIVSGGELYKALKVGCPSGRIVYASVGKKTSEIEEAIRRNIFSFNVESEPELATINQIAGRLRKRSRVSLRLNPDVDAMTHKYITTGKSENKFGLDLAKAAGIYRNTRRYPNLNIDGVHIHIGSQITESLPFVKAIKKTLRFIDSLKVPIKNFNIGGGMGIIYSDERPQTAQQFAKRIIPLLKGRPFRLILEPGRFIAGNSGILVTRVIYIKQAFQKKFAIVDAGMNDLIRPSLYSAYHEILPVRRQAKAPVNKYDIVGPICESGDFLAKDRRFNRLKTGDLLAVMGAGAYGFTMASNYNSRPRVSEIMVEGRRVCLVRRAETYKDLIKGEILPRGI
ncbi:MAG: diaminopimelate decarboxylase [Candidatus Omnitrophica bacterium]|nr:diaminopimelate decarboxylase [Candidatus Omnitrophota bacterium]